MATVAHEQKRLLQVKEVAAWLDCSESTVRRLLANGQLRPVQFAGRGSTIRIARHELEAWLFGAADNGDVAA
jgi:excisionase family DNA binding protein